MHIGFDADQLFFDRSAWGDYSRQIVLSIVRYAPQHQYTFFSSGRGKIDSSRLPKGRLVVSDGVLNMFARALGHHLNFYDVKQSRVDVYHGLSHALPPLIGHSGAKSVVSIPNINFKLYPYIYSPVERLVMNMLCAYSCDVADVIIVPSVTVKRQLAAAYGLNEAKIRVSPPTSPLENIDHTDVQRREHVRHKYEVPNQFMLCVGTFEPRHNQQLIIEAMALAQSDVGLVGCSRRTTYSEEIVAYAREHNMASKVDLLYEIEAAELPFIYAMATLFVWVSTIEASPVPLIEAMRIGVPMILSDTESNRRVAGDAAVYVSPDKPEELADAIDSLMRDEPQRMALAAKGTARAESFSNRHIAEELVAIYSDL